MQKIGITRRCTMMFGRFLNLFRRISWLDDRLPVSKLYITEMVYTHPLLPEKPVSLLFVTDIHAGPYLSSRQESTLSRVLLSAGTDMIVFGGDFGEFPDDGLAWLDRCPPLSAPLGCCAIAGNHDRDEEEETDRLASAAEPKNIRVLTNETLTLPCGITIAGLDDFKTGRPNAELLREKCAGKGFVLLLTHNPDILPDICPPFYHLALCGHTHGGQVTLFGRPLISSSVYGKRFCSGWKEEQGADVLVSNGVGVSLLPVRFGARPQVIRLTLRRGTGTRQTVAETEGKEWLKALQEEKQTTYIGAKMPEQRRA